MLTITLIDRTATDRPCVVVSAHEVRFGTRSFGIYDVVGSNVPVGEFDRRVPSGDDVPGAMGEVIDVNLTERAVEHALTVQEIVMNNAHNDVPTPFTLADWSVTIES